MATPHLVHFILILLPFLLLFKDVRTFADVCGDNNPIHLDPVAAKKSIFGGTIVHG